MLSYICRRLPDCWKPIFHQKGQQVRRIALIGLLSARRLLSELGHEMLLGDQVSKVRGDGTKSVSAVPYTVLEFPPSETSEKCPIRDGNIDLDVLVCYDRTPRMCADV